VNRHISAAVEHIASKFCVVVQSAPLNPTVEVKLGIYESSRWRMITILKVSQTISEHQFRYYTRFGTYERTYDVIVSPQPFKVFDVFCMASQSADVN